MVDLEFKTKNIVFKINWHRRKKEGAPTLCNSMDRTGKHYAKCNKPGSEGQIPYDLTFNWNIPTKEKSKQNITRDIEIKTI